VKFFAAAAARCLAEATPSHHSIQQSHAGGKFGAISAA